MLKPSLSPEEKQEAFATLKAWGLEFQLLQEDPQAVIRIRSSAGSLECLPFSTLPGIERTVPLAAAQEGEKKRKSKTLRVGAVEIGPKNITVAAGPCAVEDRDILFSIAEHVKEAGAGMLRGGAFKPRTSPYSFLGLGEEGLELLRQAGDAFQMPIVTEVLDPRDMDRVAQYADVIQIGTRNMQNYPLLVEAGRTQKPVLLKRGMAAGLVELLLAAEYIIKEGNEKVILCERGVKGFEATVRNMLDISAVPNLKGMTPLPVFVDPSHGCGRRDLVPSLARAAVAAGADGLLIEVHCTPDRALSDGHQSILPATFSHLMKEIKGIAKVLKRKVPVS